MSELPALRIGLPVAMALLGVALIVLGGDQADGAGIVIIGSAGLVYGLNAMLRSSMREEGDRAREEEARDFYRAHGRWPEDPVPEPGPGPAAPAAPPAAAGPAHPGVRELPLKPRPRRRRPF